MSRRSEAAKKWRPYRSKFEKDIATALKKKKVKFKYESTKIKYTKPVTSHVYNPDFTLPNGIIIETKGRFTASDRKKHLLVREQHPEFDIRLVFQNANVRLSKASNTTYGDWADKNGFIWANKEIPAAWLKE